MIRFEKFSPMARPPIKAHRGDAGFDLFADHSEQLLPGDFRIISTGVRVTECPADVVLFITPRSGMAAKYGVTVLNAPGTVDSGYRGELMVTLINHGPEAYTVHEGDKIAQLVPTQLASVNTISWKGWSMELGTVQQQAERGASGIGSTGR